MQNHELGITHSAAAQQDNTHKNPEPPILPEHLYKFHKSIFIYLQTITVYCIHCQKYINIFILKNRYQNKITPNVDIK